MKIIDIKIKKATILQPNLREEDITSYKMIYKEKSKEKYLVCGLLIKKLNHLQNMSLYNILKNY